MERLRSKSLTEIFTVLHIILLPALIIITAYIVMSGVSFIAIAGMILVIIGFQAFFSITFASARKKMPVLMLILEPLIAFTGVLILFFLINK